MVKKSASSAGSLLAIFYAQMVGWRPVFKEVSHNFFEAFR